MSEKTTRPLRSHGVVKSSSVPINTLPPGTSCRGPLPVDALQGLPTRTVSLRALRTGPAKIDLSGSAPFAAGGLAGTVESTVVIRIRKARVRRVHPRRRSSRPRPPDRPRFRNLAVEYRLARLTGSVPVEVAAEPRACTALDACGLAGTLNVTPGPAHGEGYVYAYGRLPRIALRRALGLAPGPRPRKVSMYGYLAWTRAKGTVTAALERNGTPACRDTTPLTDGAIELRVRGRRVTAGLAGGAAGLGGAEVLRTRCPGPAANVGRGVRLAVGRIPRRALGRRRVTLHLDQGASAVASGYRLRSERFAELEEQLHLVSRQWADGPVSFEGRRYTAHDLDALPKPVQRPRPNLILGGRAGPRSLALGARFADEYNTFYKTADECAVIRRELDDASTREGRDPLPLSLMAGCLVGEDRAELLDRAGRLAAWRGVPGGAEGLLETLDDSWIVGTLDEATERLRGLAAAGVERVMLQHLLHRDLDAIRQIGRQVAPAVG